MQIQAHRNYAENWRKAVLKARVGNIWKVSKREGEKQLDKEETER